MSTGVRIPLRPLHFFHPFQEQQQWQTDFQTSPTKRFSHRSSTSWDRPSPWFFKRFVMRETSPSKVHRISARCITFSPVCVMPVARVRNGIVPTSHSTRSSTWRMRRQQTAHPSKRSQSRFSQTSTATNQPTLLSLPVCLLLRGGISFYLGELWQPRLTFTHSQPTSKFKWRTSVTGRKRPSTT